MKIDMPSARGPYIRNPQKETAVAQHDTPVKNTARQDVVDISHGALPADKSMLALKTSVHSFLSTPAAPERIAELKTRIAEGTYYVPTEKLVDAVLAE